MKQTLSELMRMSRICRMIFATCLGSFILVIFYFQIMRRNPFMVEGCCRKGSRNALQELYNPTQVGHCDQILIFHPNLRINSLQILPCGFMDFFSHSVSHS
uniref:Uncharacterized protein n=1 Tax=Maylandia zebra TaxID=106582 RepID=A0A3P9BJY6_9CICH